MSELSTTPVFTCKRCQELFTLAHLSTASSDISGEQLREFMSSIKEIGLCPKCLEKKQWYADQGRLDDWEAGRP